MFNVTVLILSVIINIFFKNLASKQQSANSSCKTSLFLDAFRFTAIDFLGVLLKAFSDTLAIAGANDHKGWLNLRTETGEVVEKF